MGSKIINNMKNIEEQDYLELGVATNINFSAIRCLSKQSVDVNGNATFTGTTDEYFDSLKDDTNFDIIYIDANHDLDYVSKDYNNSVSRSKNWILIHDMIPPNEKFTASNYCSDSYRLLYYLMTQTENVVYPLDNDYGLTFIKCPAKAVDIDCVNRDLSFNEFKTFIDSQKLYSNEEIINILNDSPLNDIPMRDVQSPKSEKCY